MLHGSIVGPCFLPFLELPVCRILSELQNVRVVTGFWATLWGSYRCSSEANLRHGLGGRCSGESKVVEQGDDSAICLFLCSFLIDMSLFFHPVETFLVKATLLLKALQVTLMALFVCSVLILSSLMILSALLLRVEK